MYQKCMIITFKNDIYNTNLEYFVHTFVMDIMGTASVSLT